MSTYAIVLASGMGVRFGAQDTPKHLTSLNHVPIICWAVHNLLAGGIFKNIIVVCDVAHLIQTKEILNKYFVMSHGIEITSGARERMGSFFNGLDYIRKNIGLSGDDLVFLVDANRPMITEGQLINLKKLALEFGASCPVRPVVNGIAKVKENELICVLEKSELYDFVTPDVIKAKYLLSLKESDYFSFSSCIDIALKNKISPKTIPAHNLNVKLTYPEDLAHMQKLIKANNLAAPELKK